LLTAKEGLDKEGKMRDQAGQVFRLAESYSWVPGCTLSGEFSKNDQVDVEVFSLAPRTQISAESYQIRRLWIVSEGQMWAKPHESSGIQDRLVRAGELYIVPKGQPIGVRTDVGCVYMEIQLKEDSTMNEILKSGEVFKLADLVPYQDGRIVSMDLIDQEKVHFAVISFSEGTSLKEHAAPGEALVTALDGEGVIGYEGKEYSIRAGENFKFDKNGRHYVKAVKKFKMALLLVND
jgi:quercetin dioxygenase-like cupin family protein